MISAFKRFRSAKNCIREIQKHLGAAWQGWALDWLSDRSSASGHSTFEAGGAYLAAKWGTNRRSADRFLARLERLGIVEITYRGGRHDGRNNARRVAFSRAALSRLARRLFVDGKGWAMARGAQCNNADKQGQSSPSNSKGCAQLDNYPGAWVVPSWVREDPLWGRDVLDLPDPPVNEVPPVGMLAFKKPEKVLSGLSAAWAVLRDGALGAGGAL